MSIPWNLVKGHKLGGWRGWKDVEKLEEGNHDQNKL